MSILTFPEFLATKVDENNTIKDMLDKIIETEELTKKAKFTKAILNADLPSDKAVTVGQVAEVIQKLYDLLEAVDTIQGFNQYWNVERLTSELEFYKKEHSNISELKLKLKEYKIKLEIQREQILFSRNIGV